MRRIEVGGVELCVDTFGEEGDRPMLLIAGASASMDLWPPELCERFAAGGRFVIRYDHRDTGQSVTYPPGEPGYDGNDLSADAVGVLDALGVEAADLVGISMGGGIAQDIALAHPDRVASLTLMSTSVVDRELPEIPLPDGVEPFVFDLPDPDWSDRDAVVDYLVAFERSMASKAREYDEESARRAVAAMVDRADDIAAIFNHDAMAHGEPPLGTGSRTSRCRRSSSTAPTTRCSRSATARRSPPPSPEPACWSSTPSATSCRPRAGTASSPRSSPSERSAGGHRVAVGVVRRHTRECVREAVDRALEARRADEDARRDVVGHEGPVRSSAAPRLGDARTEPSRATVLGQDGVVVVPAEATEHGRLCLDGTVQDVQRATVADEERRPCSSARRTTSPR